MSAPAGWYADAAGTPRWWDGYGWADSSTYSRTPLVMPQVAPGTSTNTVWVWLGVLLPLLSVIPTFGYLDQMRRGMLDVVALIPRDGSTPDPQALVEAQLGMVFNGWYLVVMVVSWAMYGVSVWFAVLDARELSARGFLRPFHWAWSFVGASVYVIGRHVVIYRRGGRGAGPLWVTIATQVALVLATIIWSAVLTVQLMEAVLALMPTW